MIRILYLKAEGGVSRLALRVQFPEGEHAFLKPSACSMIGARAGMPVYEI